MLFSMISNNYALNSEAETLCFIGSLMGKALQGKRIDTSLRIFKYVQTVTQSVTQIIF